MKIIPVIDVKGGRVVRAVAGRRDEYRPVVSRLCDSTEPSAVAGALLRASGADTLYVADLDAIEQTSGGQVFPGFAGSPGATFGSPFQGSMTEPFTGDPNEAPGEARTRGDTPRSLWLDAGVRTADDADRIAERATAVVVGSETAGPDVLREAVRRLGPDRVVFSLDLKDGVPLGRAASRAPLELAHLAHEAGVRKVIVLDLAAVGVGAGTRTDELCSRILKNHPDLELIAGGGVRDRDDLARLADVGVSAALVASALHSGGLP